MDEPARRLGLLREAQAHRHRGREVAVQHLQRELLVCEVHVVAAIDPTHRAAADERVDLVARELRPYERIVRVNLDRPTIVGTSREVRVIHRAARRAETDPVAHLASVRAGSRPPNPTCSNSVS